MKPCEICEGEGTLYWWYDGPENGWCFGKPYSDGWKTKTQECDICNGTGEIPENDEELDPVRVAEIAERDKR
jgi:hypothetical protein